MSSVRQCKTCPWKVGCVPSKDIPNYDRRMHEGLRSSIRSDTASLNGQQIVMVCHHADVPCAGWLYNQLGVGNNIGVRIAVLVGRLPEPDVDGEQHETFAETLG